MKKIAVFASGNGSNAQKIFEFFENHNSILVELLVCNNPKAKVIEKAKAFHISSLLINRKGFFQEKTLLDELKKRDICFIALAGFLWLVPNYLIENFPNMIINIHPALLPKYGGPGMYGMNIHRCVKENRDKESGITIHYVNEKFDEGSHVFQKKTEISEEMSSEEIAGAVLKLEHYFYPKVIKKILDP